MTVRSRLARFGAGLGLTLLLVVGAELTLRLIRGPVPPPPLVRQMWDAGQAPFSESGGMVEPLFQGRDEAGNFPAEASPGTPRVMVFGESSVRAGSYLPVAQEFPALLQGKLGAAGIPAEVLNLGRVGMDSHSIRTLIPAALAYHPDAAVLYYGHNDIGNAFFLARYSSVTQASAAHARAFFQQFQLYATLRDLVVTPPAAPGQGEKPPISTAPNEAQRALAVSEYQANLEIAVRTLQAAGVAVVLVTPMSRDGIYEANDAVCPMVVSASAWTKGQAGYVLRPELLSLVQGEAAVDFDPNCPEALYLRGWWRQVGGDLEGGWADLRAARDNDPRPIRASAGIIAAMRAVAANTGARLVDTVALNGTGLARTTDDWFIDPVHPSATGHIRLAEMIEPVLAEELAR